MMNHSREVRPGSRKVVTGGWQSIGGSSPGSKRREPAGMRAPQTRSRLPTRGGDLQRPAVKNRPPPVRCYLAGDPEVIYAVAARPPGSPGRPVPASRPASTTLLGSR